MNPFLFYFLFALALFFMTAFLVARSQILTILSFYTLNLCGIGFLFLIKVPILALIFFILLTIFSGMLLVLSISTPKTSQMIPGNNSTFYKFSSITIALTLCGLIMKVFVHKHLYAFDKAFVFSKRTFSTKIMGEVIFSSYLLPFFVLTIILFTAIIGISMIHGKKKKKTDRDILGAKLNRDPNSIQLKNLKI